MARFSKEKTFFLNVPEAFAYRAIACDLKSMVNLAIKPNLESLFYTLNVKLILKILAFFYNNRLLAHALRPTERQ